MTYDRWKLTADRWQLTGREIKSSLSFVWAFKYKLISCEFSFNTNNAFLGLNLFMSAPQPNCSPPLYWTTSLYYCTVFYCAFLYCTTVDFLFCTFFSNWLLSYLQLGPLTDWWSFLLLQMRCILLSLAFPSLKEKTFQVGQQIEKPSQFWNNFTIKNKFQIKFNWYLLSLISWQ